MAHIADLERRVELQEEQNRFDLNKNAASTPVDAQNLQGDSSAPVNNATATHSQIAMVRSPQLNTREHASGAISHTSRVSEQTIIPSSALSSSEKFGAEVRTMLASSGTPTDSRHTTTMSLPAPTQAVQSTPGWPSAEEAYGLLEVVVINIGISQQLFDVRTFADDLHLLFEEPTPRWDTLKIMETLLIFAIGRLLQADLKEAPDLPGAALYGEAMRQLPALPELRRAGPMALGVLGLAAFYLQLTDRKEDAYVYSSGALRLAIIHNMHRMSDRSKSRPSVFIHQNRLWWTIYMQERRLAATGGYPMAINDDSITSPAPHDYPGFSSSSALSMNVRIARITGQISSVIYSQGSSSEASFISDVERMLHSLHETESTMPTEYVVDFRPGELQIAKQPFRNAPFSVSRTSASLYLMLFQAIIHAIRPILLHMVRNSREHGWHFDSMSPALMRLAEICVESASKVLFIEFELRSAGILAKHAFLDLDALFSSTFIFVLGSAISPGNSKCITGIQGGRSILRHLTLSGNNVAVTRLLDIDQMCSHLELSLGLGDSNIEDATISESLVSLKSLCEPFSFAQPKDSATDPGAGAVTSGPGGVVASAGACLDANSTGVNHLDDDHAQQTNDLLGTVQAFPQTPFNYTDLSQISLEGEDDLYWMYQNLETSIPGTDSIDWFNFDSHMS